MPIDYGARKYIKDKVRTAAFISKWVDEKMTLVARCHGKSAVILKSSIAEKAFIEYLKGKEGFEACIQASPHDRMILKYASKNLAKD